VLTAAGEQAAFDAQKRYPALGRMFVDLQGRDPAEALRNE
jgi:hypothetical protein